MYLCDPQSESIVNSTFEDGRWIQKEIVALRVFQTLHFSSSTVIINKVTSSNDYDKIAQNSSVPVDRETSHKAQKVTVHPSLVSTTDDTDMINNGATINTASVIPGASFTTASSVISRENQVLPQQNNCIFNVDGNYVYYFNRTSR